MKLSNLKSLDNTQSLKIILVILIFVIVAIFEYSTPNDYVFGYLYCGVILLVNHWFDKIVTLQLTALAVILTIVNIWLPPGQIMKFSVIFSRIIAAVALIVTGFLSQRLRSSQEAIALAKTQLEAQEKLVRLREDFASTLTHDLKTPLLGAIETIKAFQEEKFGSVTLFQQQVLTTMTRSHQNSLHLVETLLDIYRNDTGGLQLNLAPVNLAIIAEDVVKTLREFAANRSVYLDFSYGDSQFRSYLWVLGDTLQLQRVFSNLLINAINHSRRGGHVEIVMESQISYQVIKILDNGAGIKPEEFQMLFNRFYQAHGTRQAKGSGLGLYLSRQIIEAHGGIIWAENRVSSYDIKSYDVESGALFGFKLPAYSVQVT